MPLKKFYPTFSFSSKPVVITDRGRLKSLEKVPIGLNETKIHPLAPKAKKPTVLPSWDMPVCQNILRHFEKL